MAEKNTESTAVNQLIELVATAKPLPPDPSEDLMFQEAKPQRAPKKVSAPRMSTTVPPIHGAGEVAPLPRARAPIGTQQGLQTIKAVPPRVRITTAPPHRSATIPPLTLDDHDDDAEVTNPGPATLTRPTTQGFAAQGSNAQRLPERASGSLADAIGTRPTRPTLPPPVPTIRASGAPPVRPSAQPTSSFSYPIVPASTPVTSTPHPKQMPVAAPYTLDDEPFAPPPTLLEPTASSSWMEHDIGTQQVAKRNDWKLIAGKLIGPMIVLVIAGIFIGGYFAFDGDGGKRRQPKPTEGQKITMPVTSDTAATPVEVAKTDEAAPVKRDEPEADVAQAEPVTPPNIVAPQPAPPPVTPPNIVAAKVEPAKAEPAKVEDPATARPTLVDVRIDSNPTGATVMLIDRGKTTFLGTTPVSAAVDIARKYELVFSSESRATVVEPLDPSTQKRVSVKLSRAKSNAPAATPAAPAVVAPKLEKPVAEKPATVKLEKPVAEKPATAKLEKPATPKAESGKSTPSSGIDAAIDGAIATKPEPAKVAPKAGGEGTLMISSKPPCEILVDGKPTGLTTPQRSIALPAGAHKITLVNTAEGIKKTVSVQITADKPTKVIQDFMK